jgi:hypothetical protein
MSASDSFDLRDLLQNPEEIIAQQRAELARAEELQAKIDEVTGTATSEDERIQVSFSESAGVTALTLDPRVLRMPSEDLAAEIMRLVNAARQDTHAQIQVVLDDTLGDDARPDMEQINQQVTQMKQQMNEFMRDTVRMDGELDVFVERMRKLAEDGA